MGETEICLEIACLPPQAGIIMPGYSASGVAFNRLGQQLLDNECLPVKSGNPCLENKRKSAPALLGNHPIRDSFSGIANRPRLGGKHPSK
ncbi:MAG: hypothetical protein MZV70_35255 [Desulfobacterales bacterium]|nr:hypothetical protein [Desulfobacterales bacterium]